jgi:hypothetical protein
MAKWKKVTQHPNIETFINLDNIFAMHRAGGDLTVLLFIAGPNISMHVLETPNDIMMAQELRVM